MKKRVTIVLILIVSLIFYLNYKEDTKNIKGINETRTFKFKLDSISVVKHNLSFSDQIIYKDKLYLNDYPNQQIIEANFDGKILNRFGSYGEGPKENLLIRGFHIDDNAYYTSDTRKRVVSKINFSDSLVYYYKSKNNIEISGFLSSDKVISKGVSLKNNSRFLKFTLIDPKNEIEKDIDVSDYFDVSIPNSEWIYDGAFISSPDGGTIFITHYSNKIVKFNNKGNIDYAKNVIYEVPKIELQTNGDTTIPIANDNPQYYSASADMNYIYIQSSVGDMKLGRNYMIIDLYKIRNGEYKTSIAVSINENDVFPSSIEVYKGSLFLFYEQYYSIHKIIDSKSTPF